MTEIVQPLVTIGIPTYNRADSYLKEALESAVSQTYPNIEIVVSDNCSTDHTEVYVRGFSDPRIRYFKQIQNIPANDNFNFCLEQAKGDYFLLLHDDDMIDEDFVEACIKAAGNNIDVGVIRTGMRRIDHHSQVFAESPNRAGGLSTEDFFVAWFKGETPLHLCATLFNTKKLKEIGGFNSKYQLFQDVLAHVQLAAKFGRVDIHDPKASFRQHASQNTKAAKVNNWCKDSLFLLDNMCDLVTNEKKEFIRHTGRRFFSAHNYRLASKIQSPVARFIAYFHIFRMFDYQYSPLHFFASQALRRIRRAKGKVRQRLGGHIKQAIA